jgi:excinuclease ABC subunit A
MLLAPVVTTARASTPRSSKGLRTQGFLRARVDGEVIELDDPPKLNPRRKHRIEVIIDRLRVRPDIALRLAESFETALALGDGVAWVVPMDDPARAPIVFSNKFACTECGYSLRELEPRLFSFNNPMGACADCDGLGVRRFFDAERIVRHPQLSLAGGAIRGWDRRNPYYFQMIQSLAAHYDFDIEQPFQSCRRRSDISCSKAAVANPSRFAT